MQDWRIKYKQDFLETLINKKRWARGVYDYIKPETLVRIIRQKMKADKLDRLTATNVLINEVREGKVQI